MRDFFRASIAKGREEQGRANPLFPARKMPKWKRLFFASAGLALPLGGGIFSVHALSQPQFLISNIEITGNACLDQSVVKKEIEAELSERTWLFFTKGNTLLFQPKTLAARLTTHLPIDRADLTLNGTALHVAIVEDVVMVLVRSDDRWLLSDLQGTVLRVLSPDEIAFLDAPGPEASLPFDKIPKILLAESVPAEMTEPVYPANELAALADLDKGLRAIGLTPSRYQLEKRKYTWLSVLTNEKTYAIYIDLEHPIADQVKVLASVISQHQEVAGMSYIDLRFGNRVYMK